MLLATRAGLPTKCIFAQQSGVLGLKIKLALYRVHAVSNKHSFSSVFLAYSNKSISFLISKSPLISGAVGAMY